MKEVVEVKVNKSLGTIDSNLDAVYYKGCNSLKFYD